MPRGTRRWRFVGLLAAISALAGYTALSGDDGGGAAETTRTDFGTVMAGDLAERPADAGARADPVASTTTAAPEPVGETVNRHALQPGDCVNWYPVLDVVTRVDCDEPHDREVFHTTSHPAPFGEPFPGERAMQRFAVQACYEHFEAFSGSPYETSDLVIAVITPSKETFEDAQARHRGITCLVRRQDAEPLVGPARGQGW